MSKTTFVQNVVALENLPHNLNISRWRTLACHWTCSSSLLSRYIQLSKQKQFLVLTKRLTCQKLLGFDKTLGALPVDYYFLVADTLLSKGR